MTEMNGQGRFGVRQYVSPLPSPLWDNLTHYYSADNTSNDAKGTYNGTLVNGATYSTGKIGSAFSFDGINDYMSTSTNSIINSSLPHSYSCWVKPTALSIGIFVGNGTSMLGIRGGGNLTFFQYYVNAEVNTGYILPLNTWTHITVTYKGTSFGSNNVLIYVNGSLLYTGSLSMPAGGSKVFVGSNNAGSGGFYNGLIDEVGVWNRTLTAAEVTELYNAGAGKQYVAPVEASIVSSGLIMNLDAKNVLSYSGTGTTWTDLSGNGNNGTLTNGTAYSSANGGTMVFDGVDDYVRINTGLPESANTVSMWFKQSSSRGAGLFETSANGAPIGNGSAYLFVGLGADYLRTYNVVGYSANSAYTPTNWYNVTITGLVGSTQKVYMNGVLTTTKSISPGGYNSAMDIGVSYAGYFNGNVPVVHAYNRVLTQAEITANFNALKGRYGL